MIDCNSKRQEDLALKKSREASQLFVKQRSDTCLS